MTTFKNPLSISVPEHVIDTMKNMADEIAAKYSFAKGIEFYVLDGRNIRLQSSASKMTFYFHTAPPSAKNEIDISTQVMMGEYIGFPLIKQGGNGAYKAMKDANGFDIAYHDHAHLDVYIPLNIFAVNDDASLAFFQHIVEHHIEEYTREEREKYMWTDANRERLSKLARDVIARESGTSVEAARENVTGAEERERERREYHLRSIRELTKAQEAYERALVADKGLDEKIAKEFDYILKHPDVESFEFRDGKLIIKTKRITGRTEQGVEYDFGTYTIKYKLGTTSIRYFGDTKRKSYWTPEDPHPHVNGRNGEPCLGNVGEAVVQLSSMHEYAALVSIAIEFLKAVNTSDPAGRNVVNWDTLTPELEREHLSHLREDEEEEEEDDVERTECERCAEFVPLDDTGVVQTVYNSARDVYDEEETWCDECISMYAQAASGVIAADDAVEERDQYMAETEEY